MQDEVGHGQLIYRVVEDLGKPREACFDDLIAGKTKFHEAIHRPERTPGATPAYRLGRWTRPPSSPRRRCSGPPSAADAEIIRKICWEESFHILHGRDVVLAMMTGTDEQRELVQEALDRWWGPLMQFHGNPIPSDDDPMYQWRIKSQANEEARQQFLDGYVDQIWELGLTVPDPALRKDDEGVWHDLEPDWDELKWVVTGHGPATERRLGLRRASRDETTWVRLVVLADAA